MYSEREFTKKNVNSYLISNKMLGTKYINLLILNILRAKFTNTHEKKQEKVHLKKICSRMTVYLT